MKGRNICEQDHKKQAKLIGRIITYTILIAAAIVCLFPFIWMISTSFKETSDIYKMPPSLLPANPTLENFIEGWKGADFGMFFQNSAVVTFFGYDRDCIFFLSSSVWFCEI